MKKIVFFVVLFIMASCTRSSIFEQYELSYSRSGGFAPIYENLLIRNNTAYYFFEGSGKKFNKKAQISQEEKSKLYDAINDNELAQIREDYKKVFDNITTTVKVKNASQKIFKDDGSFIVPEHQSRWQAVTGAFESFIEAKNFRN